MTRTDGHLQDMPDFPNEAQTAWSWLNPKSMHRCASAALA